jgi:hypothetical protein
MTMAMAQTPAKKSGPATGSVIVDVEAGQSKEVTVRLERASQLSGTVFYDDGSPAVELQIQLLRKEKDGKLADVSSQSIDWPGSNGSHGTTDDRGRYRRIGMAAGEYAVRASLLMEKISVGGLLSGGESVNFSSQDGEGLSVYSGDVLRKRDAKPAKVGEGDQMSGVDITLAIAGLHTVRGTVTATRDGDALNAGQLNLEYADGGEQARYVHVDQSGNFELVYVPEGKYILRVIAGVDSEQVGFIPIPR